MRFSALLVLCSVLLAAGCSMFDRPSVPRSVREKFQGPTYQTHVVHADVHAAFAAAKTALKDMQFNFTGGGPNQGKLTAINDITPATDIRAAQQISLDVRISAVDDGTEIGAVFTELTEDTFDRHPGMATSKQIDSSGIYENYFHHIDNALVAAGAIPAPAPAAPAKPAAAK